MKRMDQFQAFTLRHRNCCFHYFSYHSIFPLRYRSSNGLMMLTRSFLLTCKKRSVVLILKCTKISLIYRVSVPFSINEWQNSAGVNVLPLLCQCLLFPWLTEKFAEWFSQNRPFPFVPVQTSTSPVLVYSF